MFRRFLCLLSIVMLVTGCTDPHTKREELKNEFNTLYKLTIDASGTTPEKFTAEQSAPIDHKALTQGTYEQHLQRCAYISDDRHKWVIRGFAEHMSNFTTEEINQKIQQVTQAWTEHGLKVRTFGEISNMIEIAVDTDSGLTMGYAVSPTREAITVSTLCTEALTPENQEPH